MNSLSPHNQTIKNEIELQLISKMNFPRALIKTTNLKNKNGSNLLLASLFPRWLLSIG